MVAVPDQRSPDRIPEGAIGSIGNQYSDSDATGHGTIEIKLPVAFNTLDRPGTVVVGHPFKVLQGSYNAMLPPVHHIGG